jgi:hypothetical protein
MPESANDNPDSGLACLVLLLRFNGVAVEPEQISHRLGGAVVDTSEILRCARAFGLKAVGGVVTPAQQLMAIVPADSHLEAEAMIPNRSIGFVVPGQSAEAPEWVIGPLSLRKRTRVSDYRSSTYPAARGSHHDRADGAQNCARYARSRSRRTS